MYAEIEVEGRNGFEVDYEADTFNVQMAKVGGRGVNTSVFDLDNDISWVMLDLKEEWLLARVPMHSGTNTAAVGRSANYMYAVQLPATTVNRTRL